MEIGRLLTAMVTPFDGEGQVDYEQARHLAQALLESGSDGLVVAGTTGESPTLTLKEKWRLFTEVKRATGGRGALIAGTGNYSTQESIELTREAERLAVDAVLLVVPYYNKPSQEGLFRHFEAIARSTSLPCILYNVPSRTAANMTADTVVRLSHIPNIIGIKEASGDLEQASRIIEHTRDDFYVWSGNDQDTLPLLSIGAYGVVSVASHIVGAQIKEMIESFLDGQTSHAARIHRRLTPLVKALFLVSNPSPVKFALDEIGMRVGRPRLPLVEPDADTAQAIRTELARHRIDLPVSV
ncbi:MAG: 4-hydroxy-tetrahydrodipicolinate synthase [Dehalococcoidia bacterium]